MNYRCDCDQLNSTIHGIHVANRRFVVSYHPSCARERDIESPAHNVKPSGTDRISYKSFYSLERLTHEC